MHHESARASHKPGVEPHAHRLCTSSGGKAVTRGVVSTAGGASCGAVAASRGVVIATRASSSGAVTASSGATAEAATGGYCHGSDRGSSRRHVTPSRLRAGR